MEARRWTAIPETHAVEEELEAAEDGQTDDAYDAVVGSASALGIALESDTPDD